MELIILLVVQILSKFLKFFYEIGLSFMLTSSEYGEFSIFLSTSLICAKIIALGGELLIVSKANKSKNEVCNVASILTSNSLLIFGVFFVVSLSFSATKMVVLAGFLAILYLVSAMFRAFLLVKLSVFFVEILWFGLSLLLCIILFKQGYASGITFIYVTIISVLISLSLMLCYSRKKLKLRFKISLFFNNFKDNLMFVKQSLPLLLTGFLSIFLSRVDVIMLDKVGNVSPDEVGYFNIVTKIGTQLLFLYQVIVVFFVPRLAKYYEKMQTVEVNKKHLCLAVISAFSVLVCFVLFQVIDHYFDIYSFLSLPRELSEKVLFVIFISQFLSVTISFYGYLLVFESGQKFEFLNTAVVIPVSIALNFLFIPTYGEIGAAFGTCLSMLLVNFLRMFEYYYIVGSRK